MQAELPQAPSRPAGSFWACLARPGLVSRLSVPERKEGAQGG
ncbi:hypothetical protein [Qipengyuania polymorpha]|nr:hypothetical protein [Qipengyuania polymorpha]